MREVFLDITGYEGLYQISNKGRVKSMKRKVNHSSSGFSNLPEKVLKPQKSGNGYCHIGLYKDGKVKYLMIARLVAIHFIPNPENKPEVNHKNGDKSNNFDYNLEWNTSSENSQHSFDKGLQEKQKGTKNPSAKLTEKQVLKIRELANDNGLTRKKIAERYNVTRQAINSIVWHKNWRHI